MALPSRELEQWVQETSSELRTISDEDWGQFIRTLEQDEAEITNLNYFNNEVLVMRRENSDLNTCVAQYKEELIVFVICKIIRQKIPILAHTNPLMLGPNAKELLVNEMKKGAVCYVMFPKVPALIDMAVTSAAIDTHQTKQDCDNTRSQPHDNLPTSELLEFAKMVSTRTFTVNIFLLDIGGPCPALIQTCLDKGMRQSKVVVILANNIRVFIRDEDGPALSSRLDQALQYTPVNGLGVHSLFPVPVQRAPGAPEEDSDLFSSDLDSDADSGVDFDNTPILPG
jgi:hypothetical protein